MYFFFTFETDRLILYSLLVWRKSYSHRKVWKNYGQNKNINFQSPLTIFQVCFSVSKFKLHLCSDLWLSRWYCVSKNSLQDHFEKCMDYQAWRELTHSQSLASHIQIIKWGKERHFKLKPTASWEAGKRTIWLMVFGIEYEWHLPSYYKEAGARTFEQCCLVLRHDINSLSLSGTSFGFSKCPKRLS